MAQGGDLRVLLGALAGVGLGGVVLLTALPLIVPLQQGPLAPATTSNAHEPAVAAAGPALGTDSAPVPDAGPAVAPNPVAAPAALRFDAVRVAPDGSGLVAGQAGPGAIVSVLAGEEVAAEVTADAEGRFVAFLDLPPSTEPRALTLRDAVGGISEETVIVAPTRGKPAEAPVAAAVANLAPSDEPVRDETAAAPDAGRATAETTEPATRDLPSDRPTPRLAFAEDPVAALPGFGAMGDAAVPLAEGQEPAAEAGPSGPASEIVSTQPGPEVGPAVRSEPEILAAGEAASAASAVDRAVPGSPEEAQSGPAIEIASVQLEEEEGPAVRDEPEVPLNDQVASAAPPAEPPASGSMDVAESGVAADPIAPAPDADRPGPAPRVTSADPPESSAPVGTEAPETSFVPDDAPPAVAVAVTGPVPSAPDSPPEHAPAPSLSDSPGALPSPEEGQPGQAAVLLSDAEGVRVLQPALPPGADSETLATVALDAIAYGGEGEVLLSGRASGGGAVRLYLDNALVAEGEVGADGQWSASLDGAEQGTFTLRLDQLDAAGEVVSRMEMPFRREARSDLAALMAEAQQAGQTIAMRTVQPGNTLWAIARDRYGEPLMYVRVYEMNRDRIRDPDLIYPGQVFILPATAGR